MASEGGEGRRACGPQAIKLQHFSPQLGEGSGCVGRHLHEAFEPQIAPRAGEGRRDGDGERREAAERQPAAVPSEPLGGGDIERLEPVEQKPVAVVAQGLGVSRGQPPQAAQAERAGMAGEFPRGAHAERGHLRQREKADRDRALPGGGCRELALGRRGWLDHGRYR